MAARLNPAPFGPEILDLRRLSARDLEPVLAEEIASWQEDLSWDFSKSAELVRRFVDLRALNGFALVDDGEISGYLYYVLEDHKGLIGDLYVRQAWRTPDRERSLLEPALEAIVGCPSVSRIESQLMMMAQIPVRSLPRTEWVSCFGRNFMRLDFRRVSLGEARVRRPIYIEKWSEQYQDPGSQVIAESYAAHIDSRINDQYRTAAGARKFLYNIVQYPGCGTFYRPASYAAFDSATGRMCGLSLASLVATESGHITQICVSPWARNTGAGYALLRQSLLTMREMGCRTVSLTVTASNHDAIRLYERVGFQVVRRFSAFVWEGF